MPRALVVEDDVTSRTLFATIARRCGFETLIAADGIEAMASIKQQTPDAIVLDLLLPHVSGFEVLGEIGRTTPRLFGFTIVVTAAPEWSLHNCAELKLVRAVLRKPLDVGMIMDELTAICENTAHGRPAGPERSA